MITSAYVQLSLKCNLKCRHCFNGSSPAASTIFESCRAHELADQLQQVGCKVVVLTGGEPTLHLDPVQQLAAALFDRGLVPLLYSNLTLLTERDLRALRESGIFTIHTSLDSPDADEHDWLRGMRGAFASTNANISCALRLGIEVWVRQTLMSFNYQKVEQMAGLLADMGVQSFRVRPVIPTGRASRELSIGPAELRQVVERLLPLRRAYRNRMSIEFLPHCFEFLLDPPELQLEVPCFVSKVFISPTGDVQGCNYFTPVVGNLFQTPLAQLWPAYVDHMRRTLQVSAVCRSCDYWRYCQGGCKARNHADGLPLEDPDPLCHLQFHKALAANRA